MTFVDAQQLIDLLRARSMTSSELAAELDVTPAKVTRFLRAIGATNVGYRNRPVWTCASSLSCVCSVERLLFERPMTVKHLARVTGFGIAEVANAIKVLQRRYRSGLQFLGHRMWFLWPCATV